MCIGSVGYVIACLIVCLHARTGAERRKWTDDDARLRLSMTERICGTFTVLQQELVKAVGLEETRKRVFFFFFSL